MARGDSIGYEPIPAAGPVELPDLDPDPADTYTNPTEITVDSKGRVTSVTEGGGGASDALTSLGSNPSVTSLAPGKYLITGGSSGVVVLAVGSVGDYWRIIVADTGVTAGNLYPGDGCHLRYGGADHTEIGYDTGTGYVAFECWKTSATRYTVLAIKAAGGTT